MVNCKFCYLYGMFNDDKIVPSGRGKVLENKICTTSFMFMSSKDVLYISLRRF